MLNRWLSPVHPFTEQPLDARPCARSWERAQEQTGRPCSRSAYCLLSKEIVQQALAPAVSSPFPSVRSAE